MKILLLIFFSTPLFASYIPGTVMSSTGSSLNGSSIPKFEFASITNSGSCSVSSQTGFISNITRPAQGKCLLTFYPGVFSTTPPCVCSPVSSTANQGCLLLSGGSSLQQIITQTTNADTGVLDDYNYNLFCPGVR